MKPPQVGVGIVVVVTVGSVVVVVAQACAPEPKHARIHVRLQRCRSFREGAWARHDAIFAVQAIRHCLRDAAKDGGEPTQRRSAMTRDRYARAPTCVVGMSDTRTCLIDSSPPLLL